MSEARTDDEEEAPLAPATPTVVRPTPRSFRRPQNRCLQRRLLSLHSALCSLPPALASVVYTL